MAMPSFVSRAEKFYPNIHKSTENHLMKTITFTNREKIMMGTDQDIFMTYLQKKLPLSNYEISAPFARQSLS
jgi:hypothetical protein